MGIKFKSNVIATQVIKYASGYSGPKDFKVFLDISSDAYKDHNHLKINLQDVLSSDRAGEVSSISSMNLLDYSKVASNTVLRSFIPDLKAFAVLTQLSTPSCLANPSASQAWLPLTGSSIYCCYSLDGGRAYIDTTQVNVISGAGTFEDPQFFRYKSTQLVSVMREKGSSSAVCQLCPYGKLPLLPAYNQNQWGIDSLILKSQYTPSKASGAVFIRYSEALRKTSAVSGVQSLMTLVQNESTHLAIAVQADGQLSMRYFIGNVEQINYKVPGLYVDRTQLNSFAVSWLNGIFTIAINGKSVVVYMFSMTEDFRCNALRLISGVANWLPESPNLAITDCVIYDRSLLERELIEATSY